ncbi:hypothetical protein BD311DRAFT_734591 [Dichomitus squalens]|uniref:Fungal-type protein kinase domain-containing protein n=1 Tax=Dichomitus squalens TaxID=114155 RepID=A0A4Q9M6I7_9APHY|nr:hypothetical protein BD311DRAFT_734591 [Dichomitus squalens]
MSRRRRRGVKHTPAILRNVRSLVKCTGKLTLPHYRAQSVIDTADRVAGTDDVQEFLDEFLPYDVPQKRKLRTPKRSKVKLANHPFRTLEKADLMSEDKVVRLFMSAAAVKEHNLAPGLGMARCQHKPDKSPKRRRRKGEEPAEPPKVDTLRQKVDAAFYRAGLVPKDQRPHWADQIVPVEFKSGQRGSAADPFASNADHDAQGQAQDAVAFDEQDDEDVPELEELEEDEDEDEEEDEDSESDEDEDDDTVEGEAQTAKQPAPQDTPAKDVFGQITTYTELVQAIQHRTAVFMLLVIGRRFRILRWDRAGVIVTPSVDYYEDPNGLCDFLWRISHVSDTTLGFDPTAIRLSPSHPEWRKMDEYALPLKTDVCSTSRVLQPGELEPPDPGSEEPQLVFDYVRKMFAESIVDPRWPRYKLSVGEGTGQRNFLVGKPSFCASGAVGRGTRGYTAIDLNTGGFVWLKDSWRVAYEKVEQEGVILSRINAVSGIDNVPTLVCHGDILHQRTLTADWWETKNAAPSARPRGVKRKRDDESEPSADPGPAQDVSDFRHDCPLLQHQHYRVVVKEVGMPLKKFQTAIQLLSLLLDCLVTHESVATHPDLRILHRDISDSNIVIVPKVLPFGAKNISGRTLNWTGILTDWEMSKPIDLDSPDAHAARQPHRSGNWQFRSVNLINNCTGTEIPDELESILLILIYYCIRYLQSSIKHDRSVAIILDEIYDCFILHEGTIACGERKDTIITKGKLSYYVPRRGLVKITFNGTPLDISKCAKPCQRQCHACPEL